MLILWFLWPSIETSVLSVSLCFQKSQPLSSPQKSCCFCYWNLEKCNNLDSETWSVCFGISGSHSNLENFVYLILLLIVEIQAGPELSPWLSENNRKHENSAAGEREETRTLYDHSQEKVKRRDSIWSQETCSADTKKFLSWRRNSKFSIFQYGECGPGGEEGEVHAEQLRVAVRGWRGQPPLLHVQQHQQRLEGRHRGRGQCTPKKRRNYR